MRHKFCGRKSRGEGLRQLRGYTYIDKCNDNYNVHGHGRNYREPIGSTVSAGNRNSGLRMALNVRNDIAPRKLPLEVASEKKSRRRQSSVRSSGY